MNSASCADPRSRYLAKDTRVVLSWKDDKTDCPNFFGDTRAAFLLFQYSLHRRTATCKLRMPSFNFNRKSKNPLYMLIDPIDIMSLQRCSGEAAIPDRVVQSFACKRSSSGITCLRLKLRKPIYIVGPSEITELHPVGHARRDVLATLRSLSRAVELDLYLPQQHDIKTGFDPFSKAISAGTMMRDDDHYKLSMFYRGKGGKGIEHLLHALNFQSGDDYAGTSDTNIVRQNPSIINGVLEGGPYIETINDDLGTAHDEDEAPPNYDQTPRSRSVRPILTLDMDKLLPRKRCPSYEELEPRASKRPSSDSKQPLPSTYLAGLHGKMNSLRQEFEALRHHLNWQTANIAAHVNSPTEDGSLADRLESFDQRLHALERRVPTNDQLLTELVPRILERLQPQIDQARHQLEAEVLGIVKGEMREHVEEVTQTLEGYKDEIDPSINYYVQEAIRDAVTEDLGEVVADQLPELVEKALEKSRFTVEISNT